MEMIQFSVKGSAENPYKIKFFRDDKDLYATCDCSAGQNGQACKHRLDILAGDFSSIEPGHDPSHPTQVLAWLKGTRLEKTLLDFTTAEAALELAKKQLAANKKLISSAMRPAQ